MILPIESKLTEIDHKRVSSLDPLGYDEFQDVLIAFNQEGIVRELIGIAEEMTDRALNIASPDIYEALAIVRDLGFIASSIKRLEIAPILEVERIDQVLHDLSSITGLPERDTLLHYTLWNPEGERMRTFTGTEEEKSFISKIKSLLPVTDEDELQKLTALPKVTVTVNTLSEAEEVINYPLSTIKKELNEEISSSFFQETLKDYFADFIVRGIRLGGTCKFLLMSA